MKPGLSSEKGKMFLSKFPHFQASHFKDFEQWTTIDHSNYQVQTLPKTQRTQGIQYFDSFNTFSSKQKHQQALKSWSNFSLVLFGKEQEIYRTTLTNLCNNYNKSLQVKTVLILTNP